jgi:predicted acyltransferase
MAAESPQPGARLVSLDAFRGFTMFWIVGGSSLALALGSMRGGELLGFIKTQLTHSPWEGLRFIDLIWPSFMLMVGVSIPFSLAKRIQTESPSKIILSVIRRAVVLFLLGSFRTSLADGRPTLVELSSALQPIAVAYLVAALLSFRSVRFQAAVGVAILVIYGAALAWVPAPGGSADHYQNGTNLVIAVDKAVLGRAHADGWGTVICTLPTISTTILGLLIGQLLRNAAVRPASKLAIIVGLGTACLAAGFALAPAVPMIMKLWTVSYGLASAGWACLMFAAFYAIIDVHGWRAWSFPLVVIGMNAIAIYLGVQIVPFGRIAGVFSKPLAAQLGSYGPLFSATAVLLLEWLVLYWMYRRKIFIRA